jgi:NAD+ synthase (glutamine-hydrolysing)
MQHGFIKVCSATTKINVADVKFNTEQIINAIKEATNQGAQVIVFPELNICGYTCSDLFNQSVLLNNVTDALISIAKNTVGNKALVFVGAPLVKSGRLYNCAVALSGGKILGVVPKSFLPTCRSEQKLYLKLQTAPILLLLVSCARTCGFPIVRP